MLKEYEGVFSDGLGKFKNVEVHIDLKEGVSPRFVKARPVPYAIKGIGGVQPPKIDFVHFYTCCSPIFPLSKIGSHVSQLLKLFVLQALTWVIQNIKNRTLQKKWQFLA